MIVAFILVLALQHEFASAGLERARPSKGIPAFAGPVKVVGKQIEPCPPEMLGKNLQRIRSGIIKQTRDKAYPRLYMVFENQEPFDDSNLASISLSSWNRVSGWAPNAVSFKFRKLCTDLTAYYHDLVDRLNNYIEGGLKLCPREDPANITVNGAPAYFIPNRNLVVAFPYGRWRADVTFMRNEIKIGCIRVFADTVPLMDSKNTTKTT